MIWVLSEELLLSREPVISCELSGDWSKSISSLEEAFISFYGNTPSDPITAERRTYCEKYNFPLPEPAVA